MTLVEKAVAHKTTLQTVGRRGASGDGALKFGLFSIVYRGMWNLPRQGSNPCPLRWQVDSSPLDHQGSPNLEVLVAANS